MRSITVWSVLCVVCAVCFGMFSGAGCDTVESSANVITFSPLSLNATGGVDVVVMVVDTNATLYLPLEWSVSEPSLGLILPQGPLTAIYRPQPVAGVTTIVVRDQGEAEGTLIVNQEI